MAAHPLDLTFEIYLKDLKARPGFFLTPADAGGNNERVYVAAAVENIH